MDTPTTKMYHVEKFLPSNCPGCRHVFQNQNVDYNIVLGDIIDGKKVIRETNGYDIIVCTHCQNFTARFPLESIQLFNKEEAEELVASGFQNLLEVEVGGKAEEHKYITGKPCLLNIRSVRCD